MDILYFTQKINGKEIKCYANETRWNVEVKDVFDDE